MTATVPAPKFDHLLRMTDRRGTFEHARFAEPRPEHGYCTDDMARVLVVATREPNADGEVNGLARVAMQFLNDAQSYAGTCRNRMDSRGAWGDEPSLEDCWGRCIWGLGTAAAHSDVGLVRRLAVIQFERAAKVRSPWPRAMAFAALGAAELLSVDPGHSAAHATPHRLRRHRGQTEPRRGLAMARAATHLCECRSRRGDDRRGRCARRFGTAASGLGSVGLAGRIRNGGRPPLAHSGSGQRAGRPSARVRSAADRGVHPRRRVRACRCHRSPVRSGPTGSSPPRPGSWVSTTHDSSCGTPRPAVDSMACAPTG